MSGSVDLAERWVLWRRDPGATPFQSPAWIEAWWQHLGQGERIDIAARDGAGRLAALLSCFVWVDGPVRRLVPIGAGTSDYSDALIDPAPDALPLLLEAIARAGDRFDEVLLPDLRPDSPLAGEMPPGWRVEETTHEICPVLALPPADTALLPALSKTMRRKLVHDRHRADRLGGVETGFASGGAEIGEALDALFALHAARWQAVGEPGVLADPRVQAFHREAAPALAAAGLLRLAVVRHQGRIVAVLYGFADGSRGFSYINGVDNCVPGQSFGTLAFALLIEAAHRDGAGEFHFLRGEEPYKYMWGAVATQTRRRVLRPPKRVA